MRNIEVFEHCEAGVACRPRVGVCAPSILIIAALIAAVTDSAAASGRNVRIQTQSEIDKTLLALKESQKDMLGIYKQQPLYYQEAIKSGVKVVSLRGKRPFFVYWLPEEFEKQKKKRVLVILHGTNGNAYRHLLNFQATAQKEGFALVSVQWGWPDEGAARRGTENRYAYLPADRTYAVMSVAIEYLSRRYGVDRNLCAWLGFSRSSTLCEAMAFYDKHRGNDYFRLFMAISGQVSPNYHMTKELASGRHGKTPLDGCHFYLWAGLRDRLRVEGMKRSKKIIESVGGTVDILRIAPEAHGGFNHSAKYQAEAVKLWKRLSHARLHSR